MLAQLLESRTWRLAKIANTAVTVRIVASVSRNRKPQTALREGGRERVATGTGGGAPEIPPAGSGSGGTADVSAGSVTAVCDACSARSG